MFELSTNSTKEHPWKLIKKRCNSTQRLHSFSQRIIDQWNSLSTETVCAILSIFLKIVLMMNIGMGRSLILHDIR